MTTSPHGRAVDRVLERIDERELADLALHLGNIESPRGEEGEVGEAIYAWCAESGLRTQRLGMFEDRFNVHAEVESRGTGPSVALNAHMDTSARRDDHLIVRNPGQPVLHTAWEDGDYLVGNPVVNDKGPLAATMIAAKALKDSGVKLAAPVYLHLVPGEIGQEPIDEFQGKRYLSKEVGVRYLLQHSPRPSFCLNAEATGLKKGWIEAGKAHMRITIYGADSKYTPYLERPYTADNPPPAILQAARAVEAIEAWAEDYEKRNRYESAGGTIIPRVSIGAMRSGDPSYILQSPELCVLYLDIRTTPLQTGAEISAELRDLLEGKGIECDVRQSLNRRSYEAQGIEPLSDALDVAHLGEFGEPCVLAEGPVTSMWRDHLIYIEMGIPGLTYGPRGEQGVSSGGQGALKVSKRDLVGCARVYALTALAVCGVGD
jgi:acetylornithine deacetylase/succinyl-diaminopimelate desuccinylase-like protein